MADGSHQFPADSASHAPARAPANVEAEQALVGAILYDNAAYERAGPALRPEHFYETFHGRLYAVMEQRITAGQLVEPITIFDRFRTDPGFVELGGLNYLADLVDRAPPAANAPGLARAIRDAAIRRELIRIGGDVAHAAAEQPETAASEIVEAAEASLYSLAEQGQASTGPRAFADVLTGALEAAAAAYSRDGAMVGLSTGLIDLDRMLGGLHPSDLIIIAGRPGMGKSALAGNIAGHAALHYATERLPDGTVRTVSGGSVLLFSLEMSGEQFAMRIVADASGISSDRIRKGQIDAAEFGMVRDAALEIQAAPLHIDDTGGISIAQLCARARRLKRTHGLDLIVVDYLQLVTTGGQSADNRVQQVSIVTQGLKALAKELNVPVVALSQLSRQVESRDDKRPKLSDLRESGSIEQDADVVAFLYREAYYLRQAEPRDGTAEHLAWQDELAKCAHLAELIIGKQRHGPVGTVRLHFNEDLTKFSNLARDDRYERPRRPEPPAERQIVFSVVRDPTGERE